MSPCSVDKAEVFNALEELSAEVVCARLGVDLHGTGPHRRTRTCAACGDRDRADAVVVTMASGLWHCKVCNAGGSLFDYAALTLGCDPERDFPSALQRVAELAGVRPGSPLDDQERERRQVERARRSAERQQAEAAAKREQFVRARRYAPDCWAAYLRRHEAGERYLAGRGLRGLVGRSDQIRFSARGDVCVVLHALDDGGPPVNVVRRRIPPIAEGEPKMKGLTGCPTLGTFGRITVLELDSTTGHVFVVEGVFDFLTAEMLMRQHGNLVLGAHGASNLPKLVAAIASELARRRRRVCFVVHEDKTGGENIEQAIEAAVSAGIELDPEIDLFNLGGAADLNDALVEGRGDVREFI